MAQTRFKRAIDQIAGEEVNLGLEECVKEEESEDERSEGSGGRS